MTDHTNRRLHDVQGRCPACRGESLMLGDGGYVTCSRIDCPEPDAASTLLERRPEPAVAAPADDDRLKPWKDMLRGGWDLDEQVIEEIAAGFRAVADAEQADLRHRIALLTAVDEGRASGARRLAEHLRTTEAVLDRVRALRDTWRGYAIVHWQTSRLLDELTRALDPQPTTPQPTPAHTGGNAEDCPACALLPPESFDYPFICPGPTATPRQ